MDACGEDCLFVDSVPPRQVRCGRTLAYPIAAHSNRGKLKYKLEARPKGMTVNKKGELKWKVPADFASETAAAIVSIRDRRNSEILHSIRIAVQKE